MKKQGGFMPDKSSFSGTGNEIITNPARLVSKKMEGLRPYEIKGKGNIEI